MDRYTIESVDPYDMEPAADGMWVMYDDAQAAIAAAVAAERERCAEIARRWGETHAGGETVNARNAASKIARGIEGPNAEVTGLGRNRSNDD